MSARFVTALDSRRIYGSRKRQLLAVLVFMDKSGREHAVPEGFIYNGPSFPIIWGGDGEAASAVHDYAYTRPDLYARAEADALLREALEAEGMGMVRRNWWWLGVRLGGWAFYRNTHASPAPDPDQPLDNSPGA